MTLSQERFMGGAKSRTNPTSPVSLAWFAERFQVFQLTTADVDLKLPPVKPGVARLDPGWPHFLLWNKADSTKNLVVKDAAGVTQFTVLPDEIAKVALRDPNGPLYSAAAAWDCIKRTASADQTAVDGTRDSVENEEEDPTFDPECREGDPCDATSLESSGVAIPMWENSCDAANQAREPIRAADFHMSMVVPVTFEEDDFTVDPLHPLATELSQAFFDALHNAGSPHFVEYDGPASGISRHWHHIRYRGDIGSLPGDWSLNPGDADAGIDVTRHVWKKEIGYRAGGVDRTLEIRVVAEWSEGCTPLLVETPVISLTDDGFSQVASDSTIRTINFDLVEEGFAPDQIINISGFTGGGYNGLARILSISGTGNRHMTVGGAFGETITLVDDASGEDVTIETVTDGGTCDTGEGLYGAAVHLFVFTDEHTALSTYTPVGAGSPVTFTKDDPAVWGGLASWGVPDKKFCHPQMVLCACLPTTFEAPCGSDWIPLGEEDRAYCYQRPNGSPWVPSPGCCGTVDAQNGIWPNIVFGDTIGTFTWGAMTVGGDFPTSQPLEWLAFENGLGTGETLLKPRKPGWDENVGDLDVAAGSSGSIRICDGAGQRSQGVCDGHVDEPLDDIGGTHKCFKNRAAPDTYCCVTIIKTESEAIVETDQRCTRTVTTYTGPNAGGTCDEDIGDCENAGSRAQSYVLSLYDYSYNYTGNQLLRIAKWRALVLDPDLVLYALTFDPDNLTGLTAEVGSYTTTSDSILAATRNNAKPIKAVFLWNPSGSVHEDGEGSCTFVVDRDPMSANKNAIHCLGVRVSVDGSDNSTGYFISYDPLTGDWVLELYQSGSATTLLSGNSPITDPSTTTVEIAATLLVDGSNLEFTLEGAGVSAAGETDDCELTTGHPCWATKSDKVAKFKDPAFRDDTEEFVQVNADLQVDQATCDVDLEATPGYGWCEGEEIIGAGGADCGTPPYCNCTVIAYSRHETLGDAWVEPLNVAEGSGQNIYGGGCNCICENRACPDGSNHCGECPPPYRAVALKLPSACAVVPAEFRASICGGGERWVFATINCD